MSSITPSKLIRYLKHGRRLLGDPEYLRVKKLTEQEEAKMPARSDIINSILSTMPKDTCYLEIGVRYPADNFDKIKAGKKYSVDPGVEFEQNPVDFPYTSDDFFSLIDKGEALQGVRFDVIFIDGLHTAEQVDRDIANALRHLNPSGFVVLHDCNPPSEWHARENYDFHHTPAGGTWNGTTWKGFLKWRYAEGLSSCCVDSDWGVGVISKSINLGPKPKISDEFYEFSFLEQHRKELLNLVDYEAFRTMLDAGNS